MFKINDYVMYGLTGVCQITDIRRDEYFGNETEYYVLRPVYSNTMTIKTPVNNPKVLMRAVLTKDEVLSLIATMPEKEPFVITNDKDKNTIFKTALKTGKNEERIKVIKTLYLEKEAKSMLNKKLAKVDDDMMKTAEGQLNEEFAIALNISPDEVVDYIHEYISHLEDSDRS
jgi:CarD family transcriptional regulator